MHGAVTLHVGPAQEAVQADGSVALVVEAQGLRVRDILQPIREDVGVGGAPHQRAEFHHGYESSKVVNLKIKTTNEVFFPKSVRYGTLPKSVRQIRIRRDP